MARGSLRSRFHRGPAEGAPGPPDAVPPPPDAAPPPGPQPRASRRPPYHPGALRRERKALLHEREERIRDLGGLVLEMYRQDRFGEELLREQCVQVVNLEVRLRELDSLLASARQQVQANRCTCGAPLIWGSHFCPNCGRPAGEPVSTCPNCGHALPAEAKFCGGCGMTAPGGPPAASPPPPESPPPQDAPPTIHPEPASQQWEGAEQVQPPAEEPRGESWER